MLELAADVIAQYPEAAAFIARRASVAFMGEAEDEAQAQRELREDERRRGYGG